MLTSLILSLSYSHDIAPTQISTLSLHDALPICKRCRSRRSGLAGIRVSGHRARSEDRSSCTRWEALPLCEDWSHQDRRPSIQRSEEHTSELQSRQYLVCRLLLEKKKKNER